MDYSILADTYEDLEKNSGKLKKAEIVSELLKKTPAESLPKVVLLIAGRVFARQSNEELGIATKMMVRAIAKASGYSESEVTNKFRETGDLGLVAQNFVKSKKQVTLSKRKLTIDKVFENIQKLATITGAGSQDRKLSLIAELLTSAKPNEACYIVRTILGTLRIGVAAGIVRDGIAKAFDVDGENVERAWHLQSDYGAIAKVAKEKGDSGLQRIRLQIGIPVQVLLCQKAESLEEAIDKFEEVAIEWKYDGVRVQIHKDGDKICLFTRRLEDVSCQFPDLVDYAKKGLNCDKCIVDGEILGINTKTGKPLPFQQLSQRVQRKYDIDRMVKEIPIQVHLFDVIYANGKALFETPLKGRRKILKEITKPIKDKLMLSNQIVTKDLKEANRFYKSALDANQEGLIVKNLNSGYQAGRRVGYWLKIKQIMETLDLVIIGAEWGTGKRANWLSSYVLACRDPDTGKYLKCGMMGTGLTDAQFKEMTEKLKPLIIEEKGRVVKIKPKVVVEIAYEEIQKSPNYESGYALRFPRLVRERTQDKGADEADTIHRLKSLFKSQGKRG